MIVVINVDDSSNLKDNRLLSQEEVLLNFLVGLGYDPLDPPLGDLLRRYHGLEGNWLIVSPMHWQATHNDAHMVAMGKDLQWTEDESKQAYQSFAKFLAADGMMLHYHNPEWWLLRVDNKPILKAKPVHQLLNKSFMPELQSLDPTLYWQKFITESQMFFATLSQQTLLNGVWLWGGAQLKKQSLALCADNSFYPLAQKSLAKVKRYEPSLCLKNYQLLLLENLDTLSESHKKELNKMTVTWYWNNTAYATYPNYLIRLWRNLIHAH